MTSRVVWKKELQSYYGGFAGYAIAAVILILVSVSVLVWNFNGGDIRIGKTLNMILPIFAVLTPLLSVHLIAGEIKKGTIQYIDVMRGSKTPFVLGKFYALVTAYTIPFVLSGLWPVVLSLYGEVAWASSYFALLAFWLFGLCLMALGFFMSCCTDNPWMAYALTICIIAIDYLLPRAALNISSSAVRNVLNNVSIFYQYRYFAVGFSDIRTILLYAGITIICLILACKKMNGRCAA